MPNLFIKIDTTQIINNNDKKAFPILIQNKSIDTIYIGYGSKIPIITEAKTKNGEWKPIENLKLGAHVLYTERDLGAGTKEDAQIDAGIHRSNRNHGRDSRIEPDMDTAPFIYKTDEDGVDHYMVSNVHFTNGYYGFTNRKTTFLETSKGLFTKII